ncbi:phage protein [Bacillus thuringiensis]|nr:hypothetical protein [Bacillus thuringiensis]MBH0338758.1 phage protein [Bacillus thuringiensis]
MEDPIAASVFGLLIACSAWLGYITYEPIKQWAWSDVKQNKKAHGNGSFEKKQVVISISRKVGK